MKHMRESVETPLSILYFLLKRYPSKYRNDKMKKNKEANKKWLVLLKTNRIFSEARS